MAKSVRTEGTPFTRRRIENETAQFSERTEADQEAMRDPWRFGWEPTYKWVCNRLDEEVASGAALNPRVSDRWYLAEIKATYERANGSMRLGAISHAAFFASQLGALWNEFELRARELGFLANEKQLRHLDERRNSGNEKRQRMAATLHAEWQEAANEVWARHPSWKKRPVAMAIVKRFPGARIDTIRRRIRKLA